MVAVLAVAVVVAAVIVVEMNRIILAEFSSRPLKHITLQKLCTTRRLGKVVSLHLACSRPHLLTLLLISHPRTTNEDLNTCSYMILKNEI